MTLGLFFSYNMKHLNNDFGTFIGSIIGVNYFFLIGFLIHLVFIIVVH